VRCLLCAVAALCVQLSLDAQGKLEASSYQRAVVSEVTVPFIGCRSEGQAKALDAPKGTVTSVPITGEAAQVLAYYRSALDFGVRAPRGWYCLGISGSGGNLLFVSPQPIDTRRIFAPEYRGFEGPAIEVSVRHSDQNGDRFDKAQIIARVFPAYKAYVTRLMEGFDFPASLYPFTPYPLDKLTYRSKEVVEYITPAQTEGLGTHSSLKKNSSPIDGVAILSGTPPDLILLAVRLPQKLARFTPVIVGQVEREASSRAP